MSTEIPVVVGARVATRLAVVEGNSQRGLQGRALNTEIVVRAQDAQGNPVSGATVTWTFVTPTEGGRLTLNSDTTSADGTVRASWVLSSELGTQSLAAVIARVQQVVVTAVAIDGSDISVARMVALQGSGQTAPVGRSPALNYVIQVLDASDRPVPNQRVLWIVGVGGGSVTPDESRTDAQGRAAANRIFGHTVGTVTTLARLAESNLAPVEFVGTSVLDSTSLRRLRVVSGTGQITPVLQPYAEPLIVRAETATGDAVPSVWVRWVMVDGGGSILGDTVALTDANGLAFVRVAAGTRASLIDTSSTSLPPAVIRVRGSLLTQPGTGVDFPLAVQPGLPRYIVPSGIPSPLALFPLDTLPAGGFRVEDAYGNPLRGAVARGRVTTGEGRLIVENTAGGITIVAGAAVGLHRGVVEIVSAPEISLNLTWNVTPVGVRWLSPIQTTTPIPLRVGIDSLVVLAETYIGDATKIATAGVRVRWTLPTGLIFSSSAELLQRSDANGVVEKVVRCDRIGRVRLDVTAGLIRAPLDISCVAP